jgi:hypothetical protein
MAKPRKTIANLDNKYTIKAPELSWCCLNNGIGNSVCFYAQTNNKDKTQRKSRIVKAAVDDDDHS